MSESNGQFEFNFLDLTPIEIPVWMGQKSKSEPPKYILREADADSAAKWKNNHLKSVKYNSDGKITSMGDLADSESLLVSYCLYYADRDGKIPLLVSGEVDNSKKVSIHVIRKWPERIVKPLFEKAKEISELEEKDTQQALEKRFVDTCHKLVGLSAGDEDRKKWDAWLRQTVEEAINGVPDGGDAEDHAKNAPSATANTSS